MKTIAVTGCYMATISMNDHDNEIKTVNIIIISNM